MYKHNVSDNSMAFMDIVFCILCFFIVMFVVQINKKEDEKAKNVESDVEYLITIDWTEGPAHDVDTYLKDPIGNLIWFSAKDLGLMNLERDDTGLRHSDYIQVGQKIIQYPYDREIIKIRAAIPGEYNLSVHLFAMCDGKNPAKVKVTIDRLYPNFQTVYLDEVELESGWREVGVCKMIVGENGSLEVVEDRNIRLAVGNGGPRDRVLEMP